MPRRAKWDRLNREKRVLKEEYHALMHSSRPSPAAHYVTPLKRWNEAEEIFKHNLPRLRTKLWLVEGLKIKLTHTLAGFAGANKLDPNATETARAYAGCMAWAEENLAKIRAIWLAAPLVRDRYGYSLDLSKVPPKLR